MDEKIIDLYNRVCDLGNAINNILYNGTELTDEQRKKLSSLKCNLEGAAQVFIDTYLVSSHMPEREEITVLPNQCEYMYNTIKEDILNLINFEPDLNMVYLQMCTIA